LSFLLLRLRFPPPSLAGGRQRLQPAGLEVGQHLRARALAQIAATVLVAYPLAHTLESPAGAAAGLQAKGLDLQPQLRTSAFREPLVLGSSEYSDRIDASPG